MNVLVIGATGKTGQSTVAALTARGAHVRAATRTPSGAVNPARTPGAAAEPVPTPGAVEPARTAGTSTGAVEVVRFDWADRTTWGPALAGVDAVYLIGPFAESDPVTLVEDFLAAATEVRRVVLLTLIGADRLPSEVPLAHWERAVRESGKEWTILRPNWFMQNFSQGFLPALRDTGVLELPAADAHLSFVDTRDVGEIAAIALTESGHDGQTYVLTGPDSLTYTDALATLSAVADRDLHYKPPSPEDFAAGMRSRGVPELAVIWQLALYDLIRSGANAPVTSTVEHLTGHPARPLSTYATENAAVWQTPETL